MKTQILTAALAMTISSFAQAKYTCVLEDKALSKSPVLTIHDVKEGGGPQLVTFYRTKDSYSRIGEITAYDRTEDVIAQLVNKKEKFHIQFYLDETDMLGMLEGSVESEYMSGNIRCVYEE